MTGRAQAARRVIVTFLPALLIFVALWPIARPIDGSGDAFQFWYAGHLVATGGSPYDQAAWHAAASRYGPIAANVDRNCADPLASVCVWAYPPLTAWLFAPFGALDPALGIPALVAFVVAAALAGVIATALLFGPEGAGSRGAFLTMAVAGHPFAFDVRAGHPVGILLIGLAALASGMRAGSLAQTVLGGMVLSLKPHVLLAVAAVSLVLLWMRGAWRALAAAAAAIALTQFAAWATAPGDLSALLGRTGPKSEIAWATTWALAGLTAVPLLAAVVVIAIGGVAFAVAVARADPGSRDLYAVAGAAALSLVVAPYLQPYDGLLALPAFALVMRGRAEPSVTALCAVVYVAGTWGVVFLSQLEPPVAHAYALLPLVALLLLVIVRPARPVVA